MAIQAQCIIPYFTGIPTDVHVNVLHFRSSVTVGDGDLDVLSDAIVDFYETVYGGVVGESMLMASYARPASFQIRYYDTEQPSPRPPLRIDDRPLTVATDASVSMPPEVAICMSFQGDRIAGVSQARRRGRIYLGVLADSSQPGTSTEFPVPSDAAMAGVASGGQGLLDFSGTGVWHWVVFSRVSETAVDVTNGWVDDAYDTQRRRGQDAGVRLPFPNPA